MWRFLKKLPYFRTTKISFLRITSNTCLVRWIDKDMYLCMLAYNSWEFLYRIQDKSNKKPIKDLQ